MTTPPALRPPAEFAHLRWHWLTLPGTTQLHPREWYMDTWIVGDMSRKYITPAQAYEVGWRYHSPCVPIDPNDPAMVERIKTAIESICSDGNSDVNRVVRDIITAITKGTT